MLKILRIRLFDRLAQPIPAAPFVVVIRGEQRPLGKADPDAQIVVRDIEVPNICSVFWSRPEKFKAPAKTAPKPEDFEFSLNVFVNIDENTSENVGQETQGQGEGAKQDRAEKQLSNLGFGMAETLQEKIMLFQRELALEETGVLDDISDDLAKRHAACDPPSRYNLPSEPQPPPPIGPQPPIPTPDGDADLELS